jgi:hypothetical protein
MNRIDAIAHILALEESLASEFGGWDSRTEEALRVLGATEAELAAASERRGQ